MTQPVFNFREALEFEGGQPRCPCTLLLDTSGSMRSQGRIGMLNEGLRTFREQTLTNPLASLRVEVSVITFNDKISLVHNFSTVDQFVPPTLTARERTFMGEGIMSALDQLEARKAIHKKYGVSPYPPCLFLITDGRPDGGFTPIMQRAADRIRELEMQKKLTFYAIGVAEADMAILAKLSTQPPMKLIGLKFHELFVWLSLSMQFASHSLPDGNPRRLATEGFIEETFLTEEFSGAQQIPFPR